MLLDENKVNQLIGLVQRSKITIESIKDVHYREAVKTALGA